MPRHEPEAAGTGPTDIPATLASVLEASDPLGRARLLGRIRDAVLAGDDGPAPPRDLVSASWQRSLDARVDPERSRARQVYADDELVDLRSRHLLAPALPLLQRLLLDAADEAAHMMIVTDVAGHILWREGNVDVLRRADGYELVEGACWSEDAVGTNAMGTALAAGRAVQIHSAEHLVSRYHSWTCAAAPVHDPDTDRVVATIDLTGPVQTFHPSTLALVRAVAELAEVDLRARLADRDERMRRRHQADLDGLHGAPGALLAPGGRVIAVRGAEGLPDRVVLTDGVDRLDLGQHGEGILEPLAEGWLLRLARRSSATTVVTLPFLGATRPVARVDGHAVPLSLRHAEILTLLALHPDGLSADGLAQALHGDSGRAGTVRAEMHRLRHTVGTAVVGTRPYRLLARVEADFLDALGALRTGAVPSLTALRRGSLLPTSDAPGVREERDHLDVATRRAVLRRGDADELWALVAGGTGHADAEIVGRLRRLLPDGDPRADELAP